MKLIHSSLLALTALLLLGADCGDDETTAEAPSEDAGATTEPAADDAVEVAGTWSSEFGDETIDSETWGSAAIVEFDNDENFAITQNPDDAEYSPGLFNKLVWTEPTDDGFHYCTVSFGLETAADADAMEMMFDDAEPDVGGCGDMGFAWTKLEPK